MHITMKIGITRMKGMMSMELTYTKQGDYLIPELKLPKEMNIGKYGMLRKAYLINHNRGLYARLMLSGSLNLHLSEIDRTARERVEQIMEALLRVNPVPNKATDPMGWTGHMNNLKQSAEEAVLAELVYS
jgi:hypothetical protein